MPARLICVRRALGDDEGALPIIAAVDHHDARLPRSNVPRGRRSRVSGPSAAGTRSTSIGAPRSSERQACRAAIELRPSAAMVSGARTSSPSFEADADDPARSSNRSSTDLASPSGGEGRVAPAPRLRRKSRNSHCGIIAMNGADVAGALRSPIVHLAAGDAQLGRDRTSSCGRFRNSLRAGRARRSISMRRGVDGVAAEIAEEVGVLLKHEHACSRRARTAGRPSRPPGRRQTMIEVEPCVA